MTVEMQIFLSSFHMQQYYTVFSIAKSTGLLSSPANINHF